MPGDSSGAPTNSPMPQVFAKSLNRIPCFAEVKSPASQIFQFEHGTQGVESLDLATICQRNSFIRF